MGFITLDKLGWFLAILACFVITTFSLEKTYPPGTCYEEEKTNGLLALHSSVIGVVLMINAALIYWPNGTQ